MDVRFADVDDSFVANYASGRTANLGAARTGKDRSTLIAP